MTNEHEEKITSLMRRGVLSPQAIVAELLRFGRNDQNAAVRIVGALAPDTLTQIHFCLDSFPTTDFGWSLLGESRDSHDLDDLSTEEIGDLQRIPFRDDRLIVDLLRESVRERLHE